MSIYKFFNKPTKEHLNDDNDMYECKLCEPAKFVKATIAVHQTLLNIQTFVSNFKFQLKLTINFCISLKI